MAAQWGHCLKLFIYTGTAHCLYVSYHMYGSAMGTLQFPGSTTSDITGDKGDSWQSAVVSYASSATEIDITGVRGSGTTSDIAIDEIYLRTGACRKLDRNICLYTRFYNYEPAFITLKQLL